MVHFFAGCCIVVEGHYTQQAEEKNDVGIGGGTGQSADPSSSFIVLEKIFPLLRLSVVFHMQIQDHFQKMFLRPNFIGPFMVTDLWHRQSAKDRGR